MATSTTARAGGDERDAPGLAWGHPARVFDLAFSPRSSDVVASASEDGTARVWRRCADDPYLWKQVRSGAERGCVSRAAADSAADARAAAALARAPSCPLHLPYPCSTKKNPSQPPKNRPSAAMAATAARSCASPGTPRAACSPRAAQRAPCACGARTAVAVATPTTPTLLLPRQPPSPTPPRSTPWPASIRRRSTP